MTELGRCTTAEATITLTADTLPDSRTAAVIDECVDGMLKWDIIKERPWGSLCTLVVKKNSRPRFCIDYRHTLNRHIVRVSWPLPNRDCCLDAVGGVTFNSTADILSGVWLLPVAEEHIDRTALVTPPGKYCFKRMPFRVCNAS